MIPVSANAQYLIRFFEDEMWRDDKKQNFITIYLHYHFVHDYW